MMCLVNSSATQRRLNIQRLFTLLMSTMVVIIASGVQSSPATAAGGGKAAAMLRFRYSAPRLPVRAPIARAVASLPRAREAGLAALAVSPSAARSQLRRALSNGPGMRIGRAWNAHHVVPLEFRSHPTIAKAARGGFNMNGASNGLRIPLSQHQRLHSAINDSHNRQAVVKLLDDLQQTRAHYCHRSSQSHSYLEVRHDRERSADGRVQHGSGCYAAGEWGYTRRSDVISVKRGASPSTSVPIDGRYVTLINPMRKG
jgi:HNH/ENDO VII superfamily nuclease